MDEQRLKRLALDGIFWDMAHNNLGVYPQAITGGPNPYTKRTERMEGWNEAGTALISNYGSLKSWYASIPDEQRELVADLLLDRKIELSVREKECTLSVNCSDLFFWGCSDGEDIALSELNDLQECLDLCPKNGDTLWVARKRGERPQGAFYSYVDKEHWHLFDAAGPERETGLGNPYKPGEYGRSKD